MCKNSDFIPPMSTWSLCSCPATYAAWKQQEISVSLLLIHFLPCAMEPDTGISNIIQFIRYKSLNTVPLKFPHFYNGTRSSRTVQSFTQYSPDEVSIQDQNISDGAHSDHHLGWSTASLMLSFPGNVILFLF